MIVSIVRHGETDWNREGRYQGQRESRLTETGRQQANALADALGGARISRVISSPLARCVDTAAPLAARLGVDIEVDRRLIEISHGTWEGRLREDLEREDPEVLRAWRETPERVRFEGGESLDDVMQRWRAFARTIGENADVAIVTHDVLVRLALLDAAHRPLSQLWEPQVRNGAYARFSVDGGIWQVLDACVDDHLGDLLVDTARQAL
ncbi:MAG: histidine phosphatase family protein [Candidatus Eremiobacteraeota bacterium]|nr:histidine phosphatase family protein [Candidatus Eremiobacteraeota bacterium]